MKMLAKIHPRLALTKTGGAYAFDPFLGPNGWTQNTVDDRYYTSSTIFDMAGMVIDDETLMIDAITTQSCGLRGASGVVAGDNITVYDIITSIPIDITKNDIQNDIASVGLGFPSSTLNFEHVLYQRMRRFTFDLDTAAAFPLLAEDRQSGALSATASDRLYSYRIVGVFITGADATVLLPPVRHVINADAKKEPDFEYLMRLKRSYDLQQVPDRD